MQLNNSYGDSGPVDYIAEVAVIEQANLISSKCDDNLHAPVIDIDLPIEVYPSSQLGHYHLYINHKMPWETYKEMLLALAKAGVVEEGFVDASIQKGYSSVRPVGVTKPGVPPAIKDVLVENAKLRQEVYMLKRELDEIKDPYQPTSDTVQSSHVWH